MTLKDINTVCKEGQLLVAAVAELMGTLYADRTPEEVLAILTTKADEIYLEGGHDFESRINSTHP